MKSATQESRMKWIAVVCAALALSSCASAPGVPPSEPGGSGPGAIGSSSQPVNWFHKANMACPIFTYSLETNGDAQRAFEECTNTTGGNCVQEHKLARDMPRC